LIWLLSTFFSLGLFSIELSSAFLPGCAGGMALVGGGGGPGGGGPGGGGGGGGIAAERSRSGEDTVEVYVYLHQSTI